MKKKRIKKDPTMRLICGGLSKREFYAGMALIGTLASPDYGNNSNDWVTKEAFDIADLMIKNIRGKK